MNYADMFYQDWAGIVRTLIVGTLGYVFIVITLRVSGNRTLSKLNAFDFVVSVAMGSVFASMLLSEGVALAEGAVAFALLCALQFAVAWGSVRSKRFAHLVRSQPVLLAKDGETIERAMHSSRITHDELHAVLRSQGCELKDAGAVFLESDGTFAVMTRSS